MAQSNYTMQYGISLLTDDDLYLFNEGSHFRIYEKMGAHPLTVGGHQGTYFSVWAPNAERVSLVGNFNHWDGMSHLLRSRGDSGIWEGFVTGIGRTRITNFIFLRNTWIRRRQGRPDCVFQPETSRYRIGRLGFEFTWHDQTWMEERWPTLLHAPISVYEVHSVVEESPGGR